MALYGIVLDEKSIHGLLKTSLKPYLSEQKRPETLAIR